MTQERLPQLLITPPIDIYVHFYVVGIYVHLCMVKFMYAFTCRAPPPTTHHPVYIYTFLCREEETNSVFPSLLVTIALPPATHHSAHTLHTVDISVHFDILDILLHVKCLYQLLITPLIDMHLHSYIAGGSVHGQGTQAS